MRYSTRPAALLLACAAGALTGCGPAIEGDWDFDGSGGGTTVTPAPTPAPAPVTSPTPTPAIDYPLFDDLAGSRAFLAGCGNLFGTSNTSSEWMGRYPDNPEALAHDYDADSDSWTIAGIARDDSNGPEYSYTFGPEDRDPGSTDAVTRYGFIDGNGSPVVFTLAKPMLGGSAAQYVRQTRLVAKPGSNKIDIHCVIGVPTEDADSIPAGNIAYGDFAISGTATSGSKVYDLGESTATWSGNGTSLQFTTSVTLVAREVTASGLSETRIQLGTYNTPYGWLNLPNKFFSGALFNSDGGNSGTFGGGLFGPQASEIAYGFSGNAVAGGMSFQYAGTLTGRR